MYELPQSIKAQIRKYQPIETEGLTFYPILVKNYDLFQIGKTAIDVMQQSLPVRLMSVPLMQAFYAMDYDAVQNGQEPIGLLSRCLLFLGLSMRLGSGDAESIVRRFRLVIDPNDQSKLKAIAFTLNGEEMLRITPVQFQRLRPILAAQNGIKLVSEKDNPELVQAEKDLADESGVPLTGDFGELISTVAALTGADESEIDEWPILKLQNRQNAFARIFGYVICSLGQTNGAKWKGGMPHPSLWFERASRESGAVAPLSSMRGAEQAVGQATDK